MMPLHCATLVILLLVVLQLATASPYEIVSSRSHQQHHNESSSLRQILRNILEIKWQDEDEDINHTLAFTLPCSYEYSASVPLIQESSSALLTAKTLAKTVLPIGVLEISSSSGSWDALSWDVLDAVLFPELKEEEKADDHLYFQSQGLLPKYWYFDQTTGRPSDYYLEGTRFPHWSLFPVLLADSQYSNSTIQSSHRLSALPLHATILGDMLLAVIPAPPNDHELDLSAPYSYNYDQNKEWWDRVNRYFQRIYDHHSYLHTVVMRGCSSSTDPASSSSVPCYNILHPWESLMEPTSPIWKEPLRPVLETIQKREWKLPFDVPSLVEESYEFPTREIYDAMMYLFLEGWNQVNLTEACPNQKDEDSNCPEDALFNATQFAVLDVGYAAILSQADADLAQLGRVLRQVLPDMHGSRNRLDQQLQDLEDWQADNAHILQERLWHPNRYSYLSQYYNARTGKMEWLDKAVSNNLVPFWNAQAANPTQQQEDASSSTNNNKGKQHSSIRLKRATPETTLEDAHMRELAQEHLQDLSIQLLARTGDYAFDCGPFPIWSQGGCPVNTSSILIQPKVNYLIGNGLLQSERFETFGHYIAGQSLELLQHDQFGEAYRVTSPYDNLATLDHCGTTCTLTAAVVYNFQVLDPPNTNRLPLPPIRRSWVITLITIELLVAFSIGVSCLVLSFNLVRRLREYTPIPLMDDEQYDSYDSYNDEPEQEEGSPQHYDSTGTSALPQLQSNGEVEPPTQSQSHSFFSSIGLN